jgi:hypothetical protein
MDYTPPPISHSEEDVHTLWKGKKKMKPMSGVDALPRRPVMAQSGIKINPANRGKFNALKKRTGKSTEELKHSPNPLTRKRATFAANAAKWHH